MLKPRCLEKLKVCPWTSSSTGYRRYFGSAINVNPPVIAHDIRRMVKEENADPNSDSVFSCAREATRNKRDRQPPHLSPVLGNVVLWLSEIAGPVELNKLLRHADTTLTISWSNGGLYYKRCDNGWDEDGNYIYVDPHTGNVAIAYARLNVLNEQRTMWDRPWTRDEVESHPWIDGNSFEQDVDYFRGEWNEENKAMIAIFRT